MISSAHGFSPEGDSGHSANSNENPPPLLLEICSGQTRFPIRPVTSRRFLIGAGDGCDLRLGGDDMPPLHCIVHVDHVEALLESVAVAPPLKVNGLVVESVLLQDGDRVEIGTFRFIAHRPPTASDAAAVPVSSPSNALILDVNPVEDRDVDITCLSAAELVERIEDEESEVKLFEQRKQLGIDAILDSVAEHVDETRLLPLAGSERETAEVPEEIERLLEHANQLADELKQRADMLADREAVQNQVAEAVFESQEELAIRLEALVARIAHLEERQRPSYPKVA